MAVKLVSNLAEYRSRELVVALEELLEAAKRGDIRGLAYIIKIGPGDNRAGLVGEYKRNSASALQATFALERFLREPVEGMA